LSYDGCKSVVKLKETVVRDYFTRLRRGDVDGLIRMFSGDAIVREPFSKLKTLNGKTEIESFLKVVIMANEGMHQELVIAKRDREASENQITAIVTFRKGSSIKCRFVFEINRSQDLTSGMIQSIDITLVD
jgi:ketosteroid isomerase-like protein